MCVILIGRINKNQHNLAKQQNPDGFSLFTAKQGLIKEPTKNQVESAIGEFGIWHYRIGTSGRRDTYNVHPFEICNGKYLLYHNGVLGAGLGEMSDTHALAETLYEVSVDTARSVLKTLSASNRFVLVSATDPTKFELFGSWSCEGGVLMSHKLYQSVTQPKYSYGGYGYRLPTYGKVGDDDYDVE